ncbi:ABC transporter substrate-binding protein [Micromonospora mirobrigensis]|uniref:Amino acid/amide ABC transporter substrate-binding protein, HAAT family (TC 3.A.1.4.-) n=1 Tax=Micromonospora mirobrigensis TaxID=262898 RepID=A0A1C4UUC4_9ACTN|nr:ABC transporter substrate-binding protein [Micromonospora mirobrigensis]SCE75259.1 amino acid/amide ABC transporter substrate-binding protein, HAAT family (TC 3.A.1.4.-) [Micromonospora mirobrigensis]
MATPAIHPSTLTRRGLLAATAGSLLLSGCGRDDQGEPRTGGSRAPDNREIVVGASLELSGPGAALGVLQERALRITADELNIDGVQVGNLRRKVRVVLRDNASDPRTAARQARELALSDNVHALIGGTLAETSMGIIAQAQEIRIPFISLAYGDGIVLPLADRTYVYKVTPDSQDVAARLVRLLVAKKHRRVVLVAGHGLHGDAGVAAMTRATAAAGVDLARVVRLPRTGQNFRPTLREVADRGPKAIVVWSHAPDTGEAARTLRIVGYRGPLYFDPAAVAEETMQERNLSSVEGAYAIHPISLGGSTLMNTTNAALARRDFAFRYIQLYGGFSGFAPYASDALTLVTDAARASGTVDRGRIRAFLRTQVSEGMAGAYAFSPSRHSGLERDSLGVYQVSRGAWTRVS